ncbi:uncharacterized protein KGF55_005585 [Candida pseudojiufengensis]|uniref:uncharacterized protein n=1 Tax=Candida pseudojiufengensis TaxID=497109 RepID=UPI0022257AB4|nr:uncharacterized protein KGF55_005585 [Candida pseudojiufengensis]KAI5959094.1 hypothetical protein KGF55_005585 [Candida pseudojiufengensis]
MELSISMMNHGLSFNQSSSCKFIESLKHPLINEFSNSINPCFLASILIIATTLFIFGSLIQLYILFFQNYYGNLKIKYSFGYPFKIKSVGIFQILKLNLVVCQLILNGLLLLWIQHWSLLSIGLIANFLLLGFIILPFHVVEPLRSAVSLVSLSLYWGFQIIFNLIITIQDITSEYKIINTTNNNFLETIEFCLLINSILILIFEVGLYLPSLELKQYFELNDWDIETIHNFWSEITFLWLDSTINHIYETNSIEVNQTPPLYIDLKCNSTYSELVKRWNEAKAKDPENVSLLKIYIQTYFWDFIKMLGLDLLTVLFNLGQAFLLQQFIIYFGNEKKQPAIVGFSIATGIFICATCRFTSLYRFAEIHFRIRTRVYSSLGTFVYQKAIVLSSEARKYKNTGEIINNLAVDVGKLAMLAMYVFVFNFPIRLTISLLALYKLLGISAFLGFITAVIMVPLSSKVSTSISKLVKQNMKIRDERTKLTSEILQSIKSIKLYAWEQPMLKRLFKIRNEKELVMAKKIGKFNAFSMFLWNTIPFAITITCLITFVKISKNALIPSIIFPALSLFDMLTDPILQLPDALVAMIEAKISFRRLTDFFLMKDNNSKVIHGNNKSEEAVIIKDATLNWDKNTIALKDINLIAKRNQLTCIVGKVGSGKTALIKSILGDVTLSSGSIEVNGSIAYCAQQPWIQNASIKDNILFGRKYDQSLYKKVISSCQLKPDLSILSDGDQTIVGEKGISLSGGQKARISLARAVYSNADIYLLDDILSAVDAHVGKKIIKEVLSFKGMLGDKTIILATNAINVLRNSNEIVLLQNGKIEERGSFEEVMSNNGDLSKLIKEHSHDYDDEDEEEEEEEEEEKELEEEVRNVETLKTAHIKEKAAKGKVKLSVYLEYFKACNFPMIFVYVFIYALNVTFNIGANYVLKYWSELNLEKGYNTDITFFISLYAIAGIVAAACMLIAALIMWSYCVLRGSKYFHDKMAQSVLRAPMQFFETTPIGRILNRFSDDINVIDQQLIWSILAVVDYGLLAIGVLSVVVFNLPIMIIVIIILFFVFNRVRAFYIPSARELKRLVSVCRSPLFSHLSESINGVDTIMAFNQDDRFRKVNNFNTDKFIRAQYTLLCCNRWLSIRLQSISAIIVYASSLFILSTLGTKHQISAGLVGFIMVNAMSISNALSMIMRGWADIETKSISVERVIEYCNLKPEAPEKTDVTPPQNWPQQGVIEFNNYSTKYRENLDNVLKNITFNIKSGEKIGVVGRTGAGKSSLTLALFRIIEPTQGSIIIDSIKSDTIGLFDLRNNLNIIPQDSNCVEGTVRENLDPLGEHTDDELWKVLELAQLKDFISQLSTKSNDEEQLGLNAMIYEGGSNLSNGQKQLLSLSRALLKDTKVLALDEASSSVDNQTDQLIQETIRNHFNDKTIITIAHRLNTIMDSDKILVLDQGELKEFDSPKNLLKDENSMFYSLCVEGGVIKK